MRKIHNRWRNPANIVGTLCSLFSLFLFLISIVLAIVGFDWSVWIFTIALIINYSITLCLSVDIINSVKKSDSFIAFYLFLFLFAPCISVFLYFLLGFDSIHEGRTEKYSHFYERYRRYEKNQKRYLKISKQSNIANQRTFEYNQIKHGIFTYTDVDVKALTSSIDILREITNLLENAKNFIHMEFYQFCDGLIFDHLINIFEKKIQEGIEIRLIVDDAGNFHRLSKASHKKLLDIGVQLRIFSPLKKSNNIWWQFRNHNKVVVVDNEYALCGSCNIADEYFNITNEYFQTTEFFAKLSGSIVSSLNSSFLFHWDLCQIKTKKETKEKTWDLLSLDGLSYFRNYPVKKTKEKIIAQFLDNSSVHNELIIKNNLIQLIFNAKKRIIISTPYFFPPKDLLSALEHARVSGVSVKILVPKNPDLIDFFRTLNRQHFSILLKQNIEIYEYFGFNHEKLMIIDDETVYFGSYNWDSRTLYLNFEHSLLINSKRMALEMSKFMDRQFKNSHKIDLMDLNSHTRFMQKCFGLFIRVFKPFL